MEVTSKPQGTQKEPQEEGCFGPFPVDIVRDEEFAQERKVQIHYPGICHGLLAPGIANAIALIRPGYLPLGDTLLVAKFLLA